MHRACQVNQLPTNKVWFPLLICNHEHITKGYLLMIKILYYIDIHVICVTGIL